MQSGPSTSRGHIRKARAYSVDVDQLHDSSSNSSPSSSDSDGSDNNDSDDDPSIPLSALGRTRRRNSDSEESYKPNRRKPKRRKRKDDKKDKVKKSNGGVSRIGRPPKQRIVLSDEDYAVNNRNSESPKKLTGRPKRNKRARGSSSSSDGEPKRRKVRKLRGYSLDNSGTLNDSAPMERNPLETDSDSQLGRSTRGRKKKAWPTEIQVDDPPYLSVGTEVSAKYKGAFCEAKVRKVVRNIKCKVAYKQGGSGTVSDEQIKSDLLRVGGTVEVKHPDRKELVEATITKIQDCSQYTVVFDDGDITTLRRSALCLKSGRHFNESETLDQLPLTHPEHFGNPVIGGRRGRRNLDLNKKNVVRSRHMPDDSSDDEEETVTAKQRIIEKEEHIGKVVCVENTETKKKSSKENWFPALVVAPTDTVRIRVKDEYLVRSFKDGRYYTVPKKEATDFTKDKASKQDSDAVQAALEYMHKDNLPPHWDRDVLFGLGNCSSDFEGDYESDTSDDEPREEKDHFVAQLYKYMDDRGTPLNKGPSITNKDVDLYRLFRAVQKLGGYNRVTTAAQWKQIATRLGYTPTTSIQNLVKQAYKKFLLPFEEFDRKLGCTMVAHPRANRIKGRNLVRAHSVASPKPEKDVKPPATVTVTTTEESESSSVEPVVGKKRKLSTSSSGKVKAMVEKYEEKFKEELKEIKTEIVEVKEEPKPKEKESKKAAAKESKESTKEVKQKEVVTEVKVEKSVEPVPSTSAKKIKEEIIPPAPPTTPPVQVTIPAKKEKGTKRQQASSDEKKPSKKRKADTEPEKPPEKVEKPEAVVQDFPVEVGDKLKVYYHEQKVTYEAKVIEISVQQGVCLYLVHYTGWNTRYDEWVPRERIAENLTNSKTIKRSKTGNSRTSSTNSDKTPHMQIAPIKQGMRKGRGGSRDSQPPRSTTPSSIASNSSRTKSPAIPAQRRTTRAQPNAIRRTSNNTDISSMQTDDSDSDSDEPVKKPSTRKIPFQRSSQTQSASSIPSASGASKPVSNTSSEEESAGASNKGRDFDLNQIRSELKGFKELKLPASEIEIETESTSEKKFECPSTTSNTESGDSILQDMAKTETSDLSSESDSYGDDDSQFSDRTTTLENISESLQEKFKAGKLDTDVFKKAVPEPTEFVEKMAVLKASGIEKIIKNSLADRSKALPEKMTMKALCERSPLKQKAGLKEKVEKSPIEIKTPTKSLNEVKPLPGIERNVVHKVEKPAPVEKSVFKATFEREKVVPSKAIFEKATPSMPASTDTYNSRSTIIEDFVAIDRGLDIRAPTVPATTSSQPASQVSTASDIYEFKEPEPFEFEAVKKLSPEVDKKTKKKSMTDLATVDSKSFPTSTTTPVKKSKKSPSKDLEPKPKPQKQPDEPDPPKIDKPSSIADKVLKALNQQQQQQQRQDQHEPIVEVIENKPSVSEKVTSSSSSPTNCDSKVVDTVVEPLILEPPKIELPTHIKKEPESQPKKPVLISPEHKLDILESIAPKNNDLSETIQKLESVIQHSADMGQMSDDSSDSTDSEQRLVIEDESQSSETQNEFNKADSQPINDLINKPPIVVPGDRKVFETQSAEENVAVGIKFPSNAHFATAQQKAKTTPEQQTTMKSAFDLITTYTSAKPTSIVQPRQADVSQIKEEPDEDQTVGSTSTIETTHNESLQLLLCEETIPGSPAPPAPRDVFTHSMDTDTNTVPMEIDDPKVIKSDNVSLNSSRHNSLSHDDSSEDVRKNDQDDITSRRRRRTRKPSESDTPAASIKRRKATSRRNTATGSDSEDNTENVQRFPERQPIKQCQYNFLVQLDSALNSHQRIAILNKQIDDLRKTYNMIKTELASIDRRRKKLRRRERENKKQQQIKIQQSTSA